MSPGTTAVTLGRINAIAAQLGLSRPEVTPLAGGLANQSWRLRDARQDFVLRLSRRRSQPLGVDRESELAMQGLAAGAGLAPRIVLANAKEGYIVTRFVSGRVPGRAEFRDTPLLERVGAWIARLQALAPPSGLAHVDFGARAAGYLKTVQEQQPQPLVADIASRLARRRSALASSPVIVACHHDLHHRNFVDTAESLIVLDWEYAGPGDPAADLASCIGYHDLEPHHVDSLLAGYGRDSTSLRARLEALGWIFDCLWFGWNAVAALSGLELDQEYQYRLAARLTG